MSSETISLAAGADRVLVASRATTLVVNGDDFGLDPRIDEGILAAHDRGILRSASLLTGAPGAAAAAAEARERPRLGVGVHLALTGGCPVLPGYRLPGLCGGLGELPPTPAAFVQRLARGRIPRAELRAELAAQVERAFDLGLRPTHVDGHQHLHLLPVVRRIVAEVAEQFDIRWVRLPTLDGPVTTLPSLLKALAVTAAARAAASRFRRLDSADHLWGLGCSGALDRRRMLGIVRTLPPGLHEVMCHPGVEDEGLARRRPWGYRWGAELAALCDPAVKRAVVRRGVMLSNYGELVVS